MKTERETERLRETERQKSRQNEIILDQKDRISFWNYGKRMNMVEIDGARDIEE